MRDTTRVQMTDKVSLIDQYGKVLFTVDRWIYETAVARGDLDRWFA